jgi:DeoR/GlpR family transcriptional regulator of sugar metabolism
MSNEGTASELVKIQRQHPEQFFTCVKAAEHDTQRKILHATLQGRGSTDYDEIRQLSTVCDRTLRKQVNKLEENGLIERVNSRVVRIAFTSFEVRVLVAHTLDCYYNK